VLADLGFSGVDADFALVQFIHRKRELIRTTADYWMIGARSG